MGAMEQMEDLSMWFFNWVNRAFMSNAKYVFHLAVVVIYPMITWRYYLRYADYSLVEVLL